MVGTLSRDPEPVDIPQPASLRKRVLRTFTTDEMLGGVLEPHGAPAQAGAQAGQGSRPVLDYSCFALSCFALAGAEATVLYPFEVVKTRQQVATSTDALRLGTVQYMRALVRDQGVRSLYRGFLWSVVGSMPAEMSYYLSYTLLKDTMLATPTGQAYPSAAYLVSGGLADAISLVLGVPADVISQRLQAEGLLQAGAAGASAGPVGGQGPRRAPVTGWDIARELYRGQGIRGLWTGVGATVAVYSPSSAVFWVSYENSKTLLGANTPLRAESLATQVLASSWSGALAASITTPLDLLKTRLQCAPAPKPMAAHMRDVVREAGGVHGLLRGFVPRVLSQTPRAIMQTVGYEMALRWSMR